jgi:hypothetical protein
MRRTGLWVSLLVLGAATACSEDIEPHGDPPCAFDGTGCLPADLVVTVDALDEGPSAVLRGTSPLEGNSWVQEGVRGTVHWRLPDGTRLDEEQTLATLTLQESPGRVPHRIELSVESEADRVTLHIARVDEDDTVSGMEVFREVQLDGGPSVVHLEPAVYVLRIQSFWPEGDAEFFFTVHRV